MPPSSRRHLAIRGVVQTRHQYCSLQVDVWSFVWSARHRGAGCRVHGVVRGEKLVFSVLVWWLVGGLRWWLRGGACSVRLAWPGAACGGCCLSPLSGGVQGVGRGWGGSFVLGLRGTLWRCAACGVVPRRVAWYGVVWL